MQRLRKYSWLIIIVVLLAVILSLPPVWSRVTYHSRAAYRTVLYWIRPPSEAVFVPSTLNEGTETTPLPVQITDTPLPQPTLEPTTPPTQSTEATLSPTATPAPTATPTPLPPAALLTGVKCERQFMNNCGPATLSMYLSFYDWGKDQIAAQGVLRPNDLDANVMPSELVDFVNEQTEQRAIWRYGGDLQTIRTLVSAGFPVMIERGFEPYSLRDEGWVGHYNLVVGYDDGIESLTFQDSYLMSYPPWGGEIPVETWDTFTGFAFSYSDLEQTWRAFNSVFIVVYPPEKENEVLDLLGPLASEEEACRIAYDRAVAETSSMADIRDQFFAWFNAGTSLVCLQDYAAAASAYDTAYGIYPDIPLGERPYRMLWYQEGPYLAYYYSERYQDVINLASQTLGYMAEPVLEESYYWRAISYHALGQTNLAAADLRTSLKYHPGFPPSIALLQEMGLLP